MACTAAPRGIRTSGRELRQMLERSGARRTTTGAEKLDFLVWLADQVKGSIEEQRRMHLKVSELADFLRREDLESCQLDAKGAVSGLLALRRREVGRLCYDRACAQDCEAGDKRFMLALMDMPAADVDKCFDGGSVAERAASLRVRVQEERTAATHCSAPGVADGEKHTLESLTSRPQRPLRTTIFHIGDDEMDEEKKTTAQTYCQYRHLAAFWAALSHGGRTLT
eukprot:CAMPEP_0171093572 /NCGR_PEP_ID=MMETSP0766_2-20121228/39156_1 /TAXON_ID=439317 /ORGANISM="Gambierdiscus australes, Strain CAWD 149" /LENGTH=224 /DNA_ID=CAMNT_0011552037 /DNA_START=60 /DNA_END=735 /DNA_ORIENTATION=+